MNGNKLRLYDFADSRHLDEVLSKEAGFSAIQLMGQAALASLYHLPKCKRIFILCGPGNNGGDGLALAYMLASRSLVDPIPKCFIISTSCLQMKSSIANFYAELVQKLAIPLQSSSDFLNIDLNREDLIIEALLGTGQRAPLTGEILKLLLHIRKMRCQPGNPNHCNHNYGHQHPMLISLDLPAGLSETEPSSFLALGSALPNGQEKKVKLSAPDEVHCYGVDKLALGLSPSLCAYTRIRLLPIGLYPLPDRVTRSKNIWRYEIPKEGLGIERSYVYKNPEGHKYIAGHGLIIGGSTGMEGALLMAAKSFFASGGGILHVLVADSKSRHFLSQALPTAMFHDQHSLPDDIQPHCILIGPGLAKDDIVQAQSFLSRKGLLASSQQNEVSKIPHQKVKHESEPYIILDATAIQLISQLKVSGNRTVLLPHTGEWKATLGAKAIVDCHSLYVNLDFYAANFGCHVLVKDSICVLFSTCQKAAENGRENNDKTKPAQVRVTLFSQPNAALSVAGSGDCLGGILLALLAKKNSTNSQVNQYQLLEEVENKIMAACTLLHKATRGRNNPRADEFAQYLEASLY